MKAKTAEVLTDACVLDSVQGLEHVVNGDGVKEMLNVQLDVIIVRRKTN